MQMFLCNPYKVIAHWITYCIVVANSFISIRKFRLMESLQTVQLTSA